LSVVLKFQKIYSVSLILTADTISKSRFTTVLGYVKEELERKLFLNFIHLDDLAISIKEVEKLAKGDKMISFENRCRRKMGTP
jgi:hypothetical protein